jgi:hypothetical protein
MRKIFPLGLIFGILAALLIGRVHARDAGHYAASPLKGWFDGLKSGKGLCCSDADGFAVSDPDWDSRDGHYRVRLNDQWIRYYGANACGVCAIIPNGSTFRLTP